jgi:hypothetical protein
MKASTPFHLNFRSQRGEEPPKRANAALQPLEIEMGYSPRAFPWHVWGF